MNYTENYHLPQWDETDRIMRTDFNQMCADMEAGLLQGRAAALDERTEINREILRMAYNHYLLVKNLDPMPDQIGLVYQCPARNAIQNASGREDSWYMAGASSVITEREFLDSVKIVSPLTLVKDNPAASAKGDYRFNSPMPGTLLSIVTQFLVLHASQTASYTFLLRLKNLDTGKVEWEMSYEDEVNANADYHLKTIRPHADFHGNTNYQLTFEVSQAMGDGTVSLLLDNSSTHVNLTGLNNVSTVNYTFNGVTESDDGLAFVRYRTYGTGGSVTVRWNGQEIQPILEKETTGTEPIRELIYRLPERPMAGNQITLIFQCNAGGEMWIYDWGAFLC